MQEKSTWFRIIYRNKFSLILPVLVGFLIYSDYQRTKRFKLSHTAPGDLENLLKNQMILPIKYYIRAASSVAILSALCVAGHNVHKYLLRDHTSFRDKSALYGRDLQEGEAPSW